MSLIKRNLQGVNQLISGTKRRVVARARAPRLIAVSKTQTLDSIREAFAAGQRAFGENYVQEAVNKIEALSELRADGIEWHLLGPLQSNKAKLAATHFDWVQSVDREKIAGALDHARQACHRPPLNVLVQVNVSGEPHKSGVPLIDAWALIERVSQYASLRLRGLMAIVENTDSERDRRRQFGLLRALFESAGQRLGDANRAEFDTLSMGMSGDFVYAIEEGSNMVRVGTAIFGARQ